MTTTPSRDPGSEQDIPRCPSCGSEDVRRYAYGYIPFENDEKRQDFEQKFVLGGCTISDDSARFHCDSCGEDYR